MKNKDTLKGIGILLAVVAIVIGLFLFGSASGPQKAKCIADALKAKMEVANIDKHCGLSKRN